MDKLVAVRLGEDEMEKLDELVAQTGLNQSQVLRQLIRNATVRPVEVVTNVASPMAAPALEIVTEVP